MTTPRQQQPPDPAWVQMIDGMTTPERYWGTLLGGQAERIVRSGHVLTIPLVRVGLAQAWAAMAPDEQTVTTVARIYGLAAADDLGITDTLIREAHERGELWD